MAKCYRRNWRCDADSGSDVEGEKPILIVLENFNEAIKNNKLVEALAEGRRLIGRSGTLLYRDHLVNINKNKIESIYSAFQSQDWEAERVLAVLEQSIEMSNFDCNWDINSLLLFLIYSDHLNPTFPFHPSIPYFHF